jgi:protein-disulfide isomerase
VFDEVMMMNKGTAIVGFILSFVAGMMLMWGINRSSGASSGGDDIKAESATTWSDSGSPIPVASDDPMWGKRDAPVTMVVFSDFECPFCSRIEGTIDQVKQQYGPDKVRVLWKNQPLPFHKAARPAAVAAATVHALAGNEAFWKFHKSAFANQKALTRENFEKWAQEAGVNMQKFKEALDKNTYADKVDKDAALAGKLGVRGTPHTIVNGVSVNGAQPLEKFKEVVDAQLKEAQALTAQGKKKNEVYVELTKKNWKEKPAAPEGDTREPAEDKTVWKVPAGDSPVRGAADALVTVIVFSEYQCPFCKRVEPTFEQLLKDYEGKVRIVWKDRPLPFHNRAEPAAVLAREARKVKGDAGFWAAHDLLFENQPKFEDENLQEYAKKLGLNWVTVKDAIDKKKHAEGIGADVALADAVNAKGTPHMFINGRRIVGAQPVDKFKAIVDEELKKAEELVKGGTPKAKVYETIMKDAKEPPPPPPPEKKDVPAPTADNPFKGGKNAKIVIQLFSDFQCPFCGRVEPSLEQVLAKYGDKVKIVWRNLPLPFHQDAQLAAEATVEVFKQKGNNGFWKYHDVLFNNQKTPDGLKRPALEKYAEELGVDMTKFRAALDNRTHKAFVEAEAKMANGAGISGTPASVVNCYFVSGAQPFDQFDKMIQLAEKELKK